MILDFCCKTSKHVRLNSHRKGAACARIRNNASSSETPKKSTVGNIEKVPKNGSTLSHYGIRTTSMAPILRLQIVIRRVNIGYITKNEFRVDAPQIRSTRRTHRPTCFKKNDKCRANLRMMVCNKSYLFDNEHVLANSNDFHVVRASENATDGELQAKYWRSELVSLEPRMSTDGGDAIVSHSKAAASVSISESAQYPYFRSDIMQY